MSYEIEFARQFIRSERGITPLSLRGDSNFTGSRLDRCGRPHSYIVKRWCPIFNMVGVKESSLLDSAKASTGRDSQQHWRSSGKWIDDAGLMRWCKSGIQNAMTLEEIREQNPRLHLRCSLCTHLPGEFGIVTLQKDANSTEEFDAWIDAAHAAANETQTGTSTFCVQFETEKLQIKKQHRFEGPAIVRYKKEFYLEQRGDGQYRYSVNAFRNTFTSFDEAMAAAKNVNLLPFQVLPANPDSMFVIREDGVHNRGLFYCKTAGHRIWDTPHLELAKKYKTLKAAERQATRLMDRRQNSSRTVVQIDA